jgi:hypothetical protein
LPHALPIYRESARRFGLQLGDDVPFKDDPDFKLLLDDVREGTMDLVYAKIWSLRVLPFVGPPARATN